jgi:general nucleoside transport system ATP-binding protein
MSKEPAIAMEGITKIFGENFKANDSIDFKVRRGTIHALVGENGAGKSTLMNILYGLYSPTSGTIKINGTLESINSPREAISLGIGMVHQHFMLVGTLSVLENILLGYESTDLFGKIDVASSTQRTLKLLESFSISIDLKEKAENLPVGIQQKVEILKVLYRNSEILILDEPTAVLTPQETDELFNTLKVLKSTGKTIIIISHKLKEVLKVSDYITVLRHGKVAGELKTSETGRDELSRLIVGGEFSDSLRQEFVTREKTVLSIKELSVLNDKKFKTVRSVSFEIKAGEIFGIAGVEGQSELIEAICGLRRVHSGSIWIDGQMIDSRTPVSHIPADRHKYAMVKEYDISKNVLLGRQREGMFSTSFAVKYDRLRKYSDQLIKEYDIRPSDPLLKIDSLSGGNQQKVVVSRELSKIASLIIAAHPTRGLDIKASAFVRESLLKQKEKAVLLISSDLLELLKISSRIAVLFNGEITGLFNACDTNEMEIGLYMTGMKTNIK